MENSRICQNCYAYRPLHEDGIEREHNPMMCKLMPPQVHIVKSADMVGPEGPVGWSIGSFQPHPPPTSSCNSFERRAIGEKRSKHIDEMFNEEGEYVGNRFGPEDFATATEPGDEDVSNAVSEDTPTPEEIVNSVEEEAPPVFEVCSENVGNNLCHDCAYYHVSEYELPCSKCIELNPENNKYSFFKRVGPEPVDLDSHEKGTPHEGNDQY